MRQSTKKWTPNMRARNDGNLFQLNQPLAPNPITIDQCSGDLTITLHRAVLLSKGGYLKDYCKGYTVQILL